MRGSTTRRETSSQAASPACTGASDAAERRIHTTYRCEILATGRQWLKRFLIEEALCKDEVDRNRFDWLEEQQHILLGVLERTHRRGLTPGSAIRLALAIMFGCMLIVRCMIGMKVRTALPGTAFVMLVVVFAMMLTITTRIVVTVIGLKFARAINLMDLFLGRRLGP